MTKIYTWAGPDAKLSIQVHDELFTQKAFFLKNITFFYEYRELLPDETIPWISYNRTDNENEFDRFVLKNSVSYDKP